MSKLEKTLMILARVETGENQNIISFDGRALLIVTVIYLVMMLGVPVEHVDNLLWFSLYPIIISPLCGVKYSLIFFQSLIILPFVLLLALFNPIFDRTVVINFNGYAISNGWLSFWGIIIRGLLSMQALLIMIHSIGFIGIVRSMERLGVPRFLTTQLLMIFRYIKVLIEEAIVMKFARDSRSYDSKHISLKLWGIMIGQLFIRSIERAERIHRAMVSRGFDGSMPAWGSSSDKWHFRDSLFVITCVLGFVFLRLVNLSLLFVR